MRNTFKKLAAITLISAGGMGIAAVAYLQSSPLALTTPKLSEGASPELEDTGDWTALTAFQFATAPVHQVAEEGLPILTRRIIPPLEPKAIPGPKRLVPCSDWVDMGPASLIREGVSDRRRVKMLCPEGASSSDYYGRDG